jgi:hypothetical protein
MPQTHNCLDIFTIGSEAQRHRGVSTKIHFMDICPCLKHTNGLIFSSLVVKRSFIGVYMKSSMSSAKQYRWKSEGWVLKQATVNRNADRAALKDKRAR